MVIWMGGRMDGETGLAVKSVRLLSALAVEL